MNKLPSVFANKIDKDLKNNDEFYRGSEEVKKKDIRDIKKYFDHNGYANKLKVKLVTKSGSSHEKIILYRDTYLVNINNEKINFEDIVDYEIE